MTKVACLLATLLLLPASASAAKTTRLAQGQAEFNRGNFAAALKHLDAAAAEAHDDETAAKLHLLRGQAFAAQQNFEDAERSFAKALEHDPEASLDPSRVDPKLVRMLDELRERTTAEVYIRAATPGSAVRIDGQFVGQSPVRKELSIGRHKVDAVSPDGKRRGETQVVVRPNRVLEVPLPMEETRDEQKDKEPPRPPSADNALQGFADLRLNWNPFPLIGSSAFEVGGGVEKSYWRAGLHFRLFPQFGVTPRGALQLPVHPKVNAVVELELPFNSSGSGLEIGLGAAGGAEWLVTRWIGVFGQVGFRYNFLVQQSEQSQLYLQTGVRFRLPKS